MFFFILLSIILLLFCIYLYLDNKNLKEKVLKLEKDTKEILERKITTNREKDLVSIENISIEKNKNQITKESVNNKKEQSISKTNSPKNIKEKYTIYKDKYTAKSNKPEPIPKISKPTDYKLNDKKTTKKYNMNKEQNFNVDEFINTKERNKYLTDIKEQLESDANLKTIELTEYEQIQEEQAVISYKELLALKEKVENNSNDENFLEDLKEFRKLLD